MAISKQRRSLYTSQIHCIGTSKDLDQITAFPSFTRRCHCCFHLLASSKDFDCVLRTGGQKCCSRGRLLRASQVLLKKEFGNYTMSNFGGDSMSHRCRNEDGCANQRILDHGDNLLTSFSGQGRGSFAATSTQDRVPSMRPQLHHAKFLTAVGWSPHENSGLEAGER